MTTVSATPVTPLTFAAWPKLIHGRVSFTAVCPCGQEARWEQIGQAGVDRYEISCSCQPPAPRAADPAA